MDGRLLRLLGGKRKISAGKRQIELWVIPASEVLQARQEARELAAGDKEAEGLCLNACILAKAAKRKGKAVFSDGKAVLEALPAEKIGRWMERYCELCRQENPFCDEKQAELRKALAQEPYERLKWKVLKAFGVLPSEKRAKEMTDGDYLYCVMQMMLDEEEFLQSLCPNCRMEAEKKKCPACGEVMPEENPGFDEARFEELRDGKLFGNAASGTEAAE